MSVRKRKVKYDCVRYGKYNISFKAYLHILRITVLLWAKRQCRRIQRALIYCKYSVLIIPFWILFAMLVYFWGQKRVPNLTLIDVFWDLKTGFFSSVVIAATTSFFTQYAKEKNKYIIQHRFYKKIMHSFSNLYGSLVSISGIVRKGEKPPSDPFYFSDDIWSRLRDTFPQTLNINNKGEEKDIVLEQIDEAKRSIAIISDKISSGEIADCTYLDFLESEERCLTSLERIEYEVKWSAEIRHWDTIVVNCISDLYCLLDKIRIPWRRDLKYKIDVLKTIYEQDKSVACTYYLQAFLGVVDYKFYEKSEEEIIRDLITKNLVTDPDQETPPGYVRVPIPGSLLASIMSEGEKSNRVEVTSHDQL